MKCSCFFSPIITIENGKTEDKVVPVNQVRPIKKENKKSEEKNNLDVVTVDFRRHKSVENKREKSAEKYRTDLTKNNGAIKKEIKQKDEGKLSDKRGDDRTRKSRTVSASSSKTKMTHDDRAEEGNNRTNIHRDKVKNKAQDRDKKEKNYHKDLHDKKDHHKKHSSTSNPDIRSRRTSNSDKKLVKSVAICDETDVDLKNKLTVDKPKLKFEDCSEQSNFISANGSQLNCTKIDRSVVVKPPNILVYADSIVAKENVKAALFSILNRDK